MSRLTISLFGAPHLAIDGTPVKILTQRAIPLLAYLAVTGSSHTREALANIFWTDSDLSHALASLRTMLWRLKSEGLQDWLILENNIVSLNNQKAIDVDVVEFRAKIKKCTTHGHPLSQVCLLCIPALTDAVQLYQGDFLTGYNLTKSHGFDDWRLQEGEALQALYLDALEKLVRGHRSFGDFNLAIQYARKLLQQDRFNETVTYDLLQLYWITGQRAAAINLYRHYRDILSRQIGIQPSEEITNLYKQILSGRISQPAAQKVRTPVILIADIENLAQLWSKEGVMKDDVLSRYQNIFTETSRRFGGSILQKSEDNITVLFDKGQPLHCAVTIHLKINKTDWGPSDVPLARMVLYSLSKDEERNNRFSLITQVASNLLSKCWGGQIIFSEQTLQVLDQPSGSKINDLGFHTLKDLDEPIHLYELSHPQLPDIKHPPLQTGVPQSAIFPILTPAFVGRESELDQLIKLTESPESRMVTLVGPGGIGKTRLAIQFATLQASRFPDGIYFISLAAIQDPELIPIVLANALKYSFYGPKNLDEQVGNYLHRMKALLVFDNFEHLRIEGSKFLVFLLNRTHDLKLMVTSRERLSLLAEEILEVHGLPVPSSDAIQQSTDYSSIRLFLQNAQRVYPRFSIENNIPDIIHICQLVNGLPLGIILASSWARVYNCAQIAEEIQKNIDFLTISSDDLPPRQRSLRAVFSSSWELLTDEESLILRRLAIFRSAFTTHAAIEICAASPQILSALLDKSLLSYQDDRYEMLETFHQFAWSMLEASDDELRSTKLKYIIYYFEFCKQKDLELNTRDQRQAMEDLGVEYEHIHIAWDWMIEFGRWELIDKMKQPLLTYHVMTGTILQGRELFRGAHNKIREHNDPGLELIRASMQQLEAWMIVKNGFISEGLQSLLQCLEVFRQHESAWNIITTMMFVADTYNLLGKALLGKKYIKEALNLIDKMDLPMSNYVSAIKAHCQSILGNIFLNLGEFEPAENLLKTSLDTHQRIGTQYGSIHPLLGLGKLAYLQGEFFQSKDLYLQALETATKIYEHRGMAVIHNNLGAIYEDIARPSESYHHTLTALKLCKETGDRRLMAVILNNLAYHQLRFLQHPAESLRTYHESREGFSDIGDLRGVAFTYYDMSKAYLQVGLLNEARESCLQALQTAVILDSMPIILHTLHGYANLYASIGEPERALRLCFLIENHPLIDTDTQKRVIVSRLELENRFPPDFVRTARQWGKSSNIQDVIDQLLSEKNH